MRWTKPNEMAGCQIHLVHRYFQHPSGFNSHGVTAIKNREATPEDVDRVMEAVTGGGDPADQKILHILPQEFIIDGSGCVFIGPVRGAARGHIVTGAGQRRPEYHRRACSAVVLRWTTSFCSKWLSSRAGEPG